MILYHNLFTLLIDVEATDRAEDEAKKTNWC